MSECFFKISIFITESDINRYSTLLDKASSYYLSSKYMTFFSFVYTTQAFKIKRSILDQ